MDTLSATELRANLYRILDHVARTGETVKIARGDKLIKIVPASPRDKLKRLIERTGYLKGNPDDIVQLDWSDQWKP